jgi:cytochrome P450
MNPDRHGESGPDCPYVTGPSALGGARLARELPGVYERLRTQWGPIAQVEIAPGVAAWLVLGHREALDIIWNERLFSSDPRRWNLIAQGLVHAQAPLSAMLGARPAISRLDGQEHRRHRRALTEALDRVDARRLRRTVHDQATALVDGWAAHGTADVMAQYARPLVWSAFARLLGLTHSSLTVLDSLIGHVLEGTDAAVRAEAELLEVLGVLVTSTRATPGPDLASWLAHSSGLTVREITHSLMALLLAGVESTVSAIGNTVRLSLTDARLGAALAGGRLTAPEAVEHALWAASPMPNIAGRWATSDVTLGGCRIHAGDLLIPCLAAANADLGVQGAGACGNRAHLAWGTGAHGCPAKEVARLIAATAVDTLLVRLTGIRLTVPDSALRWRPSLWCGAPSQLPVKFSASGTRAAAPPPSLALMAVPERRRDDTREGEAPPRWGWWDSLAGW